MPRNAKETEKKARGHRLRRGRGWRLLSPNGQQVFAATLTAIVTVNGARVAIFSVPKR